MWTRAARNVRHEKATFPDALVIEGNDILVLVFVDTLLSQEHVSHVVFDKFRFPVFVRTSRISGCRAHVSSVEALGYANDTFTVQFILRSLYFDVNVEVGDGVGKNVELCPPSHDSCFQSGASSNDLDRDRYLEIRNGNRLKRATLLIFSIA